MPDVKVTQGSIYRGHSLNRQYITIILGKLSLRMKEGEKENPRGVIDCEWCKIKNGDATKNFNITLNVV